MLGFGSLEPSFPSLTICLTRDYQAMQALLYHWILLMISDKHRCYRQVFFHSRKRWEQTKYGVIPHTRNIAFQKKRIEYYGDYWVPAVQCATLFLDLCFCTTNTISFALWPLFRLGKNFNPMNSIIFVLFDKYCPIVDQLGSKDSSRDLQLNYVISYFFYLHLILHASS
jgi:hypothetical protein